MLPGSLNHEPDVEIAIFYSRFFKTRSRSLTIMKGVRTLVVGTSLHKP